MLSLSQAAKLSGKSRSTLQRWISAGTLSATRNHRGEYLIDASELARVTPLIMTPGSHSADDHATDGSAHKLALLEQEIGALRGIVEDLRADKRDLTRRLDTSESERQRLMGLLEHQQGVETPENEPGVIRSIWKKLW